MEKQNMGIRVVELFAGVGGFHLGLRDADPDAFKVVWWNQWEPSAKKKQHAFDCYVKNFHKDQKVPKDRGKDISKVPATKIPPHDLLVGGFPCQDYSVASPLRLSQGLEGHKGALWWHIYRVVKRRKPRYLLLENVDRLLSSPKSQRGRDFAVLLHCLWLQGYLVEWRVLNAAHYGFPQKRRRVFIFAVKQTSRLGRRLSRLVPDPDYLTSHGFFQGPFPVSKEAMHPVPWMSKFSLERTLVQTSDNFKGDFRNAGVMLGGQVWTRAVQYRAPEYKMNLADCLEDDVPDEYFVPDKYWDAWEKMKDKKEQPKKSRSGHSYVYKEGKIPFPDSLEEPARTLLTGEGALTPSRSNHIIMDPQREKLRILTPGECELLMGFRPGWTEGLPQRWRYFTMGNALVVGLVEMMGRRLVELHGTDAKAKPVAAQHALAKAS